MRKFLRFVTSRLFLTFFSFFLQFLFLFVMLDNVNSYVSFAFLNFAIGLAFSLIIFSQTDVPEFRLSWLFFISIAPVFGSFMYFIFANKKRGKTVRNLMTRYRRDAESFIGENFPKSIEMQDPMDRKLSCYLEGTENACVLDCTSVRYFPSGESVFECFLEELSKARKFIFMEYFIYEKGKFWNSILEILRQKVSEGLDVRVVYDDMGCINTLPYKYEKELISYGIKAVAFNPVKPRLNSSLNYRDHRKMCIIDGNTAISGGINISDEYLNIKERFGYWKDNAILLKGKGVWNFTQMFLRLWDFIAPSTFIDLDFSKYVPTAYEETDGLVQSFCDNPLDDLNVGENTYLHIINTARNYVWITTPYLVIDSTMERALCLAASSGVDVRIVTPGIPDKKFVYAMTRESYMTLLQSGVKIYEYTPGFMHSKMFLSDDRIAVVGTINMDFRSLFLHFECAAVLYGGSVIDSVKDDFAGIFNESSKVDTSYRKKSSVMQRIEGLFAKIAAPLL